MASGPLDLAPLQHAFVSALAATKGQQSASEQIEEAHLSLNGDTLEVHTTVSATMLPIVINADADRILKGVLREQNASGWKLKLLPGAPAATPAAKAPRAAAAGSAAELAAKHPIVQEAQRLFSADISKVIDLRGKD